jgi:hypothetical protein
MLWLFLAVLGFDGLAKAKPVGNQGLSDRACGLLSCRKLVEALEVFSKEKWKCETK